MPWPNMGTGPLVLGQRPSVMKPCALIQLSIMHASDVNSVLGASGTIYARGPSQTDSYRVLPDQARVWTMVWLWAGGILAIVSAVLGRFSCKRKYPSVIRVVSVLSLWPQHRAGLSSGLQSVIPSAWRLFPRQLTKKPPTAPDHQAHKQTEATVIEKPQESPPKPRGRLLPGFPCIRRAHNG